MHRREQMRQQSRAHHGQTDAYGWAPQTGTRQQQQPPNQGPQRDTMTDVQEQFTKIAECMFSSPLMGLQRHVADSIFTL